MNTTRQEKTIKELFIGTCWEYLRDNFHKFSETNKIKIALTLVQKDLQGPLVDQSQHSHTTYVWKRNRDGVLPTEIPGGDSRLPSEVSGS